MTTKATTEQRINSIIEDQVTFGEVDIKPSSKLVEDLGADSLDLVEVIMALEEEFEVDLIDDEEKFEDGTVTVQDIYDVVKKKLEEQ